MPNSPRGRVGDASLLEVGRDVRGLSLAGTQEAPDVSFELGEVDWAAAAQGVGLDVLVSTSAAALLFSVHTRRHAEKHDRGGGANAGQARSGPVATSRDRVAGFFEAGDPLLGSAAEQDDEDTAGAEQQEGDE